jgi:hypothetical protein
MFGSFRDLAFMGAAAGGDGIPGFDTDASAYILSVEDADGQALEAGVRTAINDFVVGCKADGIWTAIKACCILAGARTRLGAMVPLVGAAPTSFNFVDADYNRKTGLVGDGSTKYLNSNRNNNADPQDDKHISVYATSAATSALNKYPTYIGGGSSATGSSVIGRVHLNGTLELRNNSNDTIAPPGLGASIGLLANSRSASGFYLYRAQGITASSATASQAPANIGIGVFHDPAASAPTASNARLAFYSIGESLDLALLDARVTTLINAFAAVIP